MRNARRVEKPMDLISRKALLSSLGARDDITTSSLTTALAEAYQAGWEVARSGFLHDGLSGLKTAYRLSYLTDQIIRVAADILTEKLYPLANPTTGERLTIVATGGYGRGELAPYSDIDLLFLIPTKDVPWTETIIEAVLYTLWDLGLKVGHAVRTPDDVIRLSTQDLTVKTAHLEARPIWGDMALFNETSARFRAELVTGKGAAFTDDKLAERDARHQRLGNSRYQVEPNIKEGKGGLRDLQTMIWIARFLFDIRDFRDLVERSFLRPSEYRQFVRSLNLIWSVRVGMHYLRGRAEERLGFDLQTELAKLFQYRNNAETSEVERFMKHYFMMAKQVGDLTRVFCALLEADQQKTPFFARMTFRRRRFGAFRARNGWLTLAADQSFTDCPALMLKIFRVADANDLDIHPETLRAISQNRKRIDDDVRADPDANADFLEMLTSKRHAETALRRLNEAGVFGQFIPDFGRVVSQMQFDMYHHYTVDEHTIRAIGLLARIEAGELTEDHPIASRLLPKINMRRALYVSVLLHDIAKGRGGDHSVLGAEVARDLCPRLGLSAAETETVAWLVRYHLLMSNTAFKRDLADPQTIEDFCKQVKSPERLRLLLCLTVVDIRAVGPGTWNSWKRQLLSTLHDAAEERLVAGHMVAGRDARVSLEKAALRDARGRISQKAVTAFANRMPDTYWIAEDRATIVRNLKMVQEAEKKDRESIVKFEIEREAGSTQVSYAGPDKSGLFARIAGALAISGAEIVSAKIHTATDGMALENFTVRAQSSGRSPGKADETFDAGLIDSKAAFRLIESAIMESLDTMPKVQTKLARSSGASRIVEDNFEIEPTVIIDNKASTQSTVIEVNAKDRPGLLFELLFVLVEHNLSVHSAHIATFGARAVDVFYVRGQHGEKIYECLKPLEDALLDAASDPVQDGSIQPRMDASLEKSVQSSAGRAAMSRKKQKMA